ncbi:ethanolamine ammonia-lyase subunit EutC [Niveispirillum cyanobacteriorum]|uniref:Ethanolamine ammonia-lyase small subunit n=1 Tax=Niveispirillum cyanobacteriorum TaxID=1612173 RepID=A0A2K9NGN3_9PROT|nr:ethanolamine ammonia-lyase subunit EutC [Niveispirillum cyanobacteriorum]AUN32261.1 ethanolamine ammonia-lyase [Niveispirillum cyanobacteriorum]GGE75728.1 ethanolamine ammonia-lyase light chain [Niveispirillum cyanobacteriorum]
MSQPPADDPLARLRAATQARIGLGRAGHAMPTRACLDFDLGHARARDAVWTPLDMEAVTAQTGDWPVRMVRSQAPDRATYLRRPDLGRELAEADGLPSGPFDLSIIIGDGLSARAAQAHGAALALDLRNRLAGWSLAPLVLAHQARVALGDAIALAMGARFALMLIGERPGLSAADSLGAYLTIDPRPGRMDSERNCVSNIRPPHGLSIAQAGEKLAWLLTEGRRIGATGIALKDAAPTKDRPHVHHQSHAADPARPAAGQAVAGGDGDGGSFPP